MNRDRNAHVREIVRICRSWRMERTDFFYLLHSIMMKQNQPINKGQHTQKKIERNINEENEIFLLVTKANSDQGISAQDRSKVRSECVALISGYIIIVFSFCDQHS